MQGQCQRETTRARLGQQPGLEVSPSPQAWHEDNSCACVCALKHDVNPTTGDRDGFGTIVCIALQQLIWLLTR